MPLSKHFRFYLWWESFFNGGHFSTCQTRKKSTPVTFFLHMRHVFLRPGVISLRRKMTPRSIFDGGRYSSLHRPFTFIPRKRPHFSRLLRNAWRYGGSNLVFTPWVPTRILAACSTRSPSVILSHKRMTTDPEKCCEKLFLTSCSY